MQNRVQTVYQHGAPSHCHMAALCIALLHWLSRDTALEEYHRRLPNALQSPVKCSFRALAQVLVQLTP